jgi:DNA-damage-inducible protein D
MKNAHSNELFQKLENSRKEIENVEYWSARDLQEVFDYTQWRNFEKVIQKAAISVKNTSESVELHFAEVSKSYNLPNGGEKIIKDYLLTRYACYLVAQNGDPSKSEIAFAQSYFATQTRKQELIEKRYLESERVTTREKLTETEKVLSQLIKQRNANFGYIRSKGDMALFGGNSTQQMKDKLNVPKNKPLSDYLQTTLLKGKDFAASLTNDNIKNRNLNETNEIANEHSINNQGVRKLMIERGIVPENLPVAEDVKKVKRRLKSESKKLIDKKSNL